MRVAVSGSHSTGKSTLIAAFLDRRPEYVAEPEAFEILADDVDFATPDTPTADGLEALLRYTAGAVAAHTAGASVVFERSPADYLAYAAASRKAWEPGEVEDFLARCAPVVRGALRNLDRIVLLPVPRHGPIEGRAGEDDRFRKRVDRRLRSVLIDDDYDLFEGGMPKVVELSADPDRQLSELLRLTSG